MHVNIPTGFLSFPLFELQVKKDLQTSGENAIFSNIPYRAPREPQNGSNGVQCGPIVFPETLCGLRRSPIPIGFLGTQLGLLEPVHLNQHDDRAPTGLYKGPYGKYRKLQVVRFFYYFK